MRHDLHRDHVRVQRRSRPPQRRRRHQSARPRRFHRPLQDIVSQARTSVGSFYARFDGKEALLPYLYARYHARLLDELGPTLELARWSELTLAETVERAVTVLVTLHREHRRLLRAVALYARSSPDAVPPEMRAERGPLYAAAARLFAIHRASIRHANPDEAIAFALFTAAALCRERILFSDAPHAAATPSSDERTARDVTRLIYTYLTCDGI